MKLLFICFASLLLFSCSSPDNSGRIESLKVLESCALGMCAQGDEQRGSMLDFVADKTQPMQLNSRANQLCNSMNQADSLSHWLMSELNSFRSKIIRKKNSKSKRANIPISLEYSSDIELNPDALPNEDQIKRIIKEIEIYRDELCETVIESVFVRPPREPYYFKKPSVASFSNDEQKTKSIRASLENSRINEEDIDDVIRIMETLTENKNTWESMLSSDQDWIDFSMSLLSMQQKVLQARFIAFRRINSRIGCRANYNITKFTPIVLGSTNALPNDTVQFEVLVVGYNEYFDQEVTVSNGGRFIKNENGKALLEAVVPDSGELNLTGEIRIKNKSGNYANPRKWSHTIKVIKEEEQIP